MADMFDMDDTSSIVVDDEQIYWTKVYDLFEANYRSTMCTSDVSTSKRKIHIDNCEFDVSHVHEPQMKWCVILFLDAVVHIAMNNTVTSRQQACIDRRQFNQHRVLQQSMDDAMMIDVLPTDVVPAMSAPELPEHNIKNSSSSSLFSEGAATLGPSIAASLSSNNDDDSVQSSINASTHSRVSPVSDIVGGGGGGGGGEKKAPPTLHEEKPLGNSFSKKGDTWSYRTWLNCWGSFEQLTVCLEYFAGSGKSASRHQLAGQSLAQQLQSVPVFHGGGGGANSGGSSDGGNATRPATFAEVFSYVKMFALRRGPLTRRNSASAAAAAGGSSSSSSSSSSSASAAKREELPTRRSSRTHERKHKASSSDDGSLPHRSSHSRSSSQSASGGETHPFEYEHLDEAMSDGSDDDDFVPTMASSKRLRAAKMGPSNSSSGGGEGGGISMIDKRTTTRGISKRQKPLPSSSSMQQSSGRSERMHLSSPYSAVPGGSSATSSSSGFGDDNFSMNVHPPCREDSYSTSGLSQIEAPDTLMSQFSYQNEVIRPLSPHPYLPTFILILLTNPNKPSHTHAGCFIGTWCDV